MGKRDKRIDSYISKSADFAKPILIHIRDLVHKACPNVEEVIKWGFPHFDYKGMMCSMAAFKQHCAFNFWKANLIKDTYNLLQTKERDAMGNLGQIKNLKDLPADKIFIKYIKEAVKLNDNGIKLPTRKIKKEKKDLVLPDYFTKALRKNKKALKTFEEFSYSHKKEYIEWITEAKTDETKNKRLETTIEWLSEGKSRNWKYSK